MRSFSSATVLLLLALSTIPLTASPPAIAAETMPITDSGRIIGGIDTLSPPGESVDPTSEDPKIIGGKDAEYFPWMTALLREDIADGYQAQYCGGALIAQRWVLTAGHCVTTYAGTVMPASAIEVAVGINDLDGSMTRIAVSQVVRHPGYNPTTLANDIALLQLDRDAGKTPITVYSGLSAQELVPSLIGETATVIGWGLDDAANGTFPTILQQLDLPVVSSVYCNINYGTTLLSSDLCAGYGYSNTSKDSCQGDSGGPLMLEIDGQWTHIGIVSSGYYCTNANGTYGIYARTSSHLAFIRQYVPEAAFTAKAVEEEPVQGVGPWLLLLLAH